MDVSNVVGSTNTRNVNPNSATAPANATALVGKGFYIKKAYLQAKLDPAFIVRLGAADLPWVPYVENQYGYRHIENTIADRTELRAPRPTGASTSSATSPAAWSATRCRWSTAAATATSR